MKMKNIKYMLDNPESIVEVMIDNINTKLTPGAGAITTGDVTTPFHNLMEASATMAADSIREAEFIIRKKEPSLAVSDKDIFHRISTDQLANMFAIPGTTRLIWYVNMINLREYGYRIGNYVETIIPTHTKITVGQTTLTTLNDIKIKLYDNGRVSAEQLNSDKDIAINNVGIINANIISTPDGTEWVILENKVKNINKYEVTTNMSGNEVSIDVPIKNKFSVCYVYWDDGTGRKPLEVTYSQDYIDPKKPTAMVTLASNNVNVTIPPVYLITKQIKGSITIEVYDCEGKHYLPLDKLPAKDFSIELGDISKSPSAASSNNIAMMVLSRTVLTGGQDPMTFKELQQSVIEQTTGDIDLPITEYQLMRKATMNGYYIDKVSDLLTSRVMVAVKNPPKTTSDLLAAQHDIFFNTVRLELDMEKDKDFIRIYENIYTIVEGTIFKYENGVTTIIDNDQRALLDRLSDFDKIQYLKTNNLYYTPYEYVFKYDENITSSDVYYFNEPKIEDIRIVGKNNNIPHSCNIDKYGVDRKLQGYKILFTLLANDDLTNTDLTKLRARLVIPVADATDITVSFDVGYDVDRSMFIIDIDTNYTSDNRVSLANGVSTIFDKNILLTSRAKLYTYTTDNSVTDVGGYLREELPKLPANATVLTKEEITVELGERLEYLYNNVYSTYTDRKYLRYLEDIPLRYTEDVYEVKENGLIVDITQTIDGQVTLSSNIIHHEGDPVIDNDGNAVLKHSRGDFVIGSDDKPIVDKMGGVQRLVDVCMLEYEFGLVGSDIYKKNNNLVMTNLNRMIEYDMKDLNNLVLDNTKVFYKSYKTATPINVQINNVTYPLDHIVKPKVILYMMNNISLDVSTLENYKNICGRIIDQHFDNSTIVLKDIKTDIIEALGSDINAVSVNGIDGRNSEILNITGSNRFVLAKELALSKNNELIVKYSLDIETMYV